MKKLMPLTLLFTFLFTVVGPNYLFALRPPHRRIDLETGKSARGDYAALFSELLNNCLVEKPDFKKILNNFEELLVKMAENSKEKYKNAEVLTESEKNSLQKTAEHTINGLLKSLYDIPGLKPTTDENLQKRILRICINEDKESVKNNLDWIKGLVNELNKRSAAFLPALILAHDINKFEEYWGLGHHEQLSYEFVKNNKLLDGIKGLTDADKKIIMLIIKHHLFLGTVFTGEGSLLKLKEILADIEKENVDKEVFFKALALFTVLDVAGYKEEGYLTNIEVTYISEILKELKNIKTEKDIEKLAKDFTEKRICGLVMHDDRWGRNYKFYSDKIIEAKNSLGISDHDWNIVLENFYKLNLYHADRTFADQSWLPPKNPEDITDKDLARRNAVADDFKVNENFIKLLIFITKVSTLNNFFEIEFVNQEGKPINKIGDDNFKNQMINLYAALNQLDRGAKVIVGKGKIYFKDKNEKVIPNAPVIYREKKKSAIKFPDLPHSSNNRELKKTGTLKRIITKKQILRSL